MANKIEILTAQKDIAGLLKILHDNDDWMTQFDAAEALVGLGNKDGLDFLKSALRNNSRDMRDVAREILQNLGHKDSANAGRQSQKQLAQALSTETTKIRPTCPKCGEPNWGVEGQSLLDKASASLVAEIGADADLSIADTMRLFPVYKVLFIFCAKCGHTISAQIIQER